MNDKILKSADFYTSKNIDEISADYTFRLSFALESINASCGLFRFILTIENLIYIKSYRKDLFKRIIDDFQYYSASVDIILQNFNKLEIEEKEKLMFIINSLPEEDQLLIKAQYGV